jgi:hypothetical protein
MELSILRVALLEVETELKDVAVVHTEIGRAPELLMCVEDSLAPEYPLGEEKRLERRDERLESVPDEGVNDKKEDRDR